MAKEYKSKFGGGKIDALLNHLDEGLSQGKDLSTNDYTTEDKSLVEGIPNKANKKGYYPSMSVGMADNLVGRGDVQDAHINFRPSAGADNITDGAARIKRIKGNSVVYNQLAENADFRNGLNRWSPTLFTVSQENDYVVLETTTKGSQQITQTLAEKIPANHKILIICDNQRYTDASLPFMFYLRKTGVSEFDTSIIPAYSSTQRRIISTIINTTAEIDSIRVYPIQQAEAGTKVNMYSIRIIDLTQMFNVGNEPTSYEEYLQRKPMNIEDEYAYTETPYIVDMKVDSLISTSDNAYDYTKGYARVMGSVPYTFTIDNRQDITPEEVYFSKTLPVTTFEENIIYPNADGTYTFPSIGYAKASFQGYEVGKEDTICVCLNHSYTKPHPAYQQEVKDLSFISEAFPEGMRSAGSAYDEIRFNPTKKVWEAVKRIGEVDLGSLNWKYVVPTDTRPFGFFYASITGRAYGAKNVMLSSYVTTNAQWTSDKSAFGNANGIELYIVESSYTDATTFKQAMQEQGGELYYELAEPIVVELDYPTAETNMDYMAWDFGTEEAIASVPSAPFRADINYEPNAVDDLRWAVSEIRNLKAQLAQMQTSVTNSTE